VAAALRDRSTGGHGSQIVGVRLDVSADPGRNGMAMAVGARGVDMTDTVTPFTIALPEAGLEDLRRRLAATRWPEPEPVDDWSQGAPLSWIQDVCRYWAEDYDWRAREAALNRFDHFRTVLDGLDVHFIHQRSPHPQALPLLITHGWPGSFVEFHKVIEPLVDPTAHGGGAADAFHVVVPTLPGFGFSGKPARTGWGVEKIATAWAALMARLGYRRYVAQGGDWGSAVTTCLGWQDPEHCAGIHITLAMGVRPRIEGEPTPAERRALDAIKRYREWDSGYSKQQSTRPQTVGYALTDSPAGQAAWILEKFWAWTDCDGHPENVLGRDELLDNVMLYWATAAAASSARLYWQSFGRVERRPVPVPTGVAVYPKEIVPPIRRWMEAGGYPNIRHWADMPKGGHFAAFEQPALFVADVRQCFRELR
jgi:epoxide hydrolase